MKTFRYRKGKHVNGSMLAVRNSKEGRNVVLLKHFATVAYSEQTQRPETFYVFKWFYVNSSKQEDGRNAVLHTDFATTVFSEQTQRLQLRIIRFIYGYKFIMPIS
ncbi:hypothetical protein CDAR_465901 [Caerostris darwini]|uniref:Uncharacterized protein n=1 Tax=Caerostris darwini TaxID=1538125 RepID=A0AAV4W9W2_9ARAC|nr:hypothetical protein CDAR_465901 [Caerostris darwini]